MKEVKQYHLGEEIASAITHGLGVIFGIVALTLLIVFAALKGTAWHVVSVSIYGSTLIILYTMSTLYHSFTRDKLKWLFKIFDHASIYLLIAGTYTPFLLVLLRNDGALGWTLFGVIWGFALIGILISSFFVGKFKLITAGCSLLMGWAIIFAMNPLIAKFNELDIKPALYWLIGGGLAYTLGVVFYVMKKTPYFHAVWHLFVLLGSVCHFVSILYIIP